LSGYELPIAMEIRCGRYDKSYQRPQALTAKGHRLMVQVQSTWFPLINRNLQKFVRSNLCSESGGLHHCDATHLQVANATAAHRSPVASN
jgi:predicted acyl esterase